MLLAMNEPSLRKFVRSVEPGGWCSSTAEKFPRIATGATLCALWHSPFTELADELGATKVGNIVMLGALLEVAQVVDDEHVDAALVRNVKSARWLELDRKALVAGKQAARRVLSAVV